MNYPPVDPYFYELASIDGASDDEIEADWRVFIDGLNTFHSDLDKVQAENPPMPDVTHKTLKDIAREIIAKFTKTETKEPKHAAP